jgi:hypothetical protein
VKREGGYVGEHMRQQLAYDVWWLVLCTWISTLASASRSSFKAHISLSVCIAERGKLTDTGRLSWFTVFAIIFEVASAYANVGFSLGVPYVRRSLFSPYLLNDHLTVQCLLRHIFGYTV